MHIVEIDVPGSPLATDGIGAVLWAICPHLADRGIELTLVVRTPPTAEGIAAAKAGGFRLLEIRRDRRTTNLRGLWEVVHRSKPDLVHLHGSFYPQMALAGALATQSHRPYAYSPHGALSPHSVNGRRELRLAYEKVIERRLLLGARGVTICTQGERDDISLVAGEFSGPLSVIPPPIRGELFSAPEWAGPSRDEPKRVIFLGRYEPFQKGIDRLVDIAAHSPSLAFDLYGETAEKDKEVMAKLRRRAPANVIFNRPISGETKSSTFSGAAMYLQMSQSRPRAGSACR
jgi:glycosyltransferase involved in cell wall biosynthesis